MALKLSGQQFLHQNLKIPESNILFEYPLIGFEVDVIDRNLNYPIECGDTSAIKLEKYLYLPSTKKFFVIPYPHLTNLLIYEFIACPAFFEYIKFKNQYSNQKNAKFR